MKESDIGYFYLSVLGSIVAIVISWSASNSVLWIIAHGILSWLYVIYFIVSR